MSCRLVASAVVCALMLGCQTHHTFTHGDSDAGPEPVDASTEIDAFVAVDAAMATDAAAPIDAFTPPLDMGHDAFVPLDAAPACMPLSTTSTPLVIHGTLATGGPTYDRPQVACGAVSASATAVHYATHELCNSGASRTFAFELDTAAASGLDDPFVLVYSGSGPIASLRCLASDDDGGAAGNDALATTIVAAGETITAVASSYSNGMTGAYVLTITPM